MVLSEPYGTSRTEPALAKCKVTRAVLLLTPICKQVSWAAVWDIP